jgi:selenocysteine lyase/cysteine desulfurase
VGLRESAQEVKYFISDAAVEAWIDQGCSLDPTDGSDRLELFAYPAQSNLSGYRCSLAWPARVREASSGQVFTLLDAASYLTTSRLSLADPASAPDFICLSFYKIFGFPDLGALLVNKTTRAASTLIQHRTASLTPGTIQRRYFGGGTVDMIINSTTRSEEWHAMKTGTSHLHPNHQPAVSLPPLNPLATPPTKPNDIHEILEDGTLPFHSILALNHAIPTHTRLFRSPSQIRLHTSWLLSQLYDTLSSLRHYNNTPIVKIYSSPPTNPTIQGPILAFNLLTSTNQYIGKSIVEAAAIACNFQLRSGGVCNPGGIAEHLDLKPWEMRRNFAEGMRCGDEMDVVAGKATGVVRVSLGAMSTKWDVRRFGGWVGWWFREDEPGIGDDDEIVGAEEGDEEVKELEVVEGLPAGKVVWRSTGEVGMEERKRRTAAALECWKNNWLLISLDTVFLEPLAPTLLHKIRDNISLELKPEDGVLMITSTTKPINSANDHSGDDDLDKSDTAEPKTLAIPLYDLPTPPPPGHLSTSQVHIPSHPEVMNCGHEGIPGHENDGAATNGNSDSNKLITPEIGNVKHYNGVSARKASLYHNPSIEAFFTRVLGGGRGRCTLARYAADPPGSMAAAAGDADADTDAFAEEAKLPLVKCSKAGCTWKGVKEEVGEHFVGHAREFEWFHCQRVERQDEDAADEVCDRGEGGDGDEGVEDEVDTDAHRSLSPSTQSSKHKHHLGNGEATSTCTGNNGRCTAIDERDYLYSSVSTSDNAKINTEARGVSVQGGTTASKMVSLMRRGKSRLRCSVSGRPESGKGGNRRGGGEKMGR